MAGSRRVYQVAERIKELLAEHLIHTADPRFSLVTITSVMVSPDLRQAKAYWVVSFPSDADRKARIAEVEEAFQSAEGLFKRRLGKELGSRASSGILSTERFGSTTTIRSIPWSR